MWVCDCRRGRESVSIPNPSLVQGSTVWSDFEVLGVRTSAYEFGKGTKFSL